MSFSGRSVATVALLLGGIIGWSSAVVAADWPRRTVHIIAPVPAGSGTDFSARLFAERLSQRWGQPVIVENRPGADGVIGVLPFLGTDAIIPCFMQSRPYLRSSRLHMRSCPMTRFVT